MLAVLGAPGSGGVVVVRSHDAGAVGNLGERGLWDLLSSTQPFIDRWPAVRARARVGRLLAVLEAPGSDFVVVKSRGAGAVGTKGALGITIAHTGS